MQKNSSRYIKEILRRMINEYKKEYPFFTKENLINFFFPKYQEQERVLFLKKYDLWTEENRSAISLIDENIGFSEIFMSIKKDITFKNIEISSMYNIPVATIVKYQKDFYDNIEENFKKIFSIFLLIEEEGKNNSNISNNIIKQEINDFLNTNYRRIIMDIFKKIDFDYSKSLVNKYNLNKEKSLEKISRSLCVPYNILINFKRSEIGWKNKFVNFFENYNIDLMNVQSFNIKLSILEEICKHIYIFCIEEDW